jgi:tetratricopeptide (TPR) repeat protein
MGVRAYYEGRWDDAIALYLRSGEVVERAGDVLTGAHAAGNRAEILLDQGRHAEAVELIDGALRTYKRARFPIGEAFATKLLGRIAAEQGRFAEAHTLLGSARDQFAALGSESLLVEADARRAQAFVLEGRHAEAAALAAEALDRMDAIGEVGVRLVLLQRLLALAAVQARTPAEAPAHFEEGLRIARELGADYEVARTLQARVATGLGSDEDAKEAEAIMERLGVVSFPSVPLP